MPVCLTTTLGYCHVSKYSLTNMARRNMLVSTYLPYCNATYKLVCAHWGCCTAACRLVSTHWGWCTAACAHACILICAYMHIRIEAYWQGAFSEIGTPLFQVPPPRPRWPRDSSRVFYICICKRYIEICQTVDNLWITFNWDTTIVGVVGIESRFFSISRHFFRVQEWLAAVSLV